MAASAAGPHERGRGKIAAQAARSSSRSRSEAGASCSAACPGVAAANVMVISGGAVGFNAASIAIGMEADVFVFDVSLDKLRESMSRSPGAHRRRSSTLAVEESCPASTS